MDAPAPPSNPIQEIFARQARLWTAVRERLQTPVDVAVLIYFRIAFGAIMLWEMWRYSSTGWIARYWIEP